MQDSTVFVKTAKGHEALTQHTELSVRVRRILILVNGSNTVDQLRQLSSGWGGMAESWLMELLEGGYIESLSTTKGTAAPRQDPEQQALAGARETLSALILDTLGPSEGAGLVERVQKCTTKDKLFALAMTFYEVLGASRGRTAEAAFDRLQPIIASLGGNIAAIARPSAQVETVPVMDGPEPKPSTTRLPELKKALSSILYEMLGPEADMMLIKMEACLSLEELRLWSEKAHGVIEGVAGPRRAARAWDRIQQLLADAST